MINEKTILMKMNHPFIVKLAGTFHDARSLFIVLEYVVGGEFFSHLRRANRFENHVGRYRRCSIENREYWGHTAEEGATP